MTRAPAAKKSNPPTQSQPHPQPELPVNWPPPLKPRQRLFLALLGLYFVWVGVLLWMYFTSVRATPQQPPATVPALAAALVDRVGQVLSFQI